MYTLLDVEKVSLTIEKLQLRVGERFPDSGLLNVASELNKICEDSANRSKFIVQPQLWLRLVVGVVIVGAVATLLLGFSLIELEETKIKLPELVQMTDAALNAAVLVGAAIYFLVSVENRIKRQRALAALHQLRAITHVIDMHQLTKDPIILTENNTASSPERKMTPLQLGRYLDYCSELLSLNGKLAAIYSQSINDSEVAASASDIEQLSSNLSRKIWQKIATLQRAAQL